MLDIEKLAQELVFLRDKIKEIAGSVCRNENTEAAFMLGCLHSICHNHAIATSQLIPKKPEHVEQPNQNSEV